MRDAPRVRRIDAHRSPARLAASWPADHPLFMLHSGRVHGRWARWSILAEPVAVYRFDGLSSLHGDQASDIAVDFSHDPMCDLNRLLDATRLAPIPADMMPMPFAGGWIGYLSYDLGRVIEPIAQSESGAVTDRDWPFLELAWCPAALLYDHVERAWRAIGEADRLVETMGACGDEIEGALPAFRIGELQSSFGADAYVAAITRTIGAIAAGDIFQANITQRFSASFAGSSRGLFHACLRASAPWYGAHLQFDDHHGRSRRLISLSPELFLQFDPKSRRVVTRPIKGTRPVHVDPEVLRRSAKDEAELNMIIDLMRNDLGRVCTFGSVHVAEPRTIETHPTVHHGVGEVRGRVRDGISTGELIAATFPAGSVTGAPKIRAMQIIDELEDVRRGPYCGALGYFSDCGNIRLNVAIRTLLLTGDRSGSGDDLRGTLDYGAGGGIVADSDPLAEYRESLDKTAVLRNAIRLGITGEAAVRT